jgi:hypothetical protein
MICSVANDKIKGFCSLVLVYVTSELSELLFDPRPQANKRQDSGIRLLLS